MNCKYCGQEIKFDNNVRSNSGKAIPLQLNGEKHDCPNNPYKNKLQNFKQVASQVENEITQNPSIFKKTDTSGRLAELETQMGHEIIELKKRVANNEQAIKALVIELSFKKGNEVDEATAEK